MVAIVDWHSAGHHRTWFHLIVQAMRERGANVLAAAPFAGEMGLDEVCDRDRDPVRFVRVRPPALQRVRPAIVRRALSQRLFATQVRAAIRRWETDLSRKINLLFFPGLFEADRDGLSAIISAVKRPWAGLLVHARSSRDPTKLVLEDVVRRVPPRALAMVDEEMAVAVSRMHPRVSVIVFPDPTLEEWEAGHPLERRFRGFAGSDKLVLQIGHLRSDKGVGTLAEIACSRDSGGFAFAFVGEVDPWLEEASKRSLDRAMNAAPRAMFHLRRVEDGRDYNAIIRSCDIIFASYTNFPHSSNTLTKAAVFRKPVVVSQGGLMARRVLAHGTGEVVPPGDAVATLAAFRRITDDAVPWNSVRQPKWDDYARAHGLERLGAAVAELMRHVE